MNKHQEAWQSIKLGIRDIAFYRKHIEVIDDLVAKATPMNPKKHPLYRGYSNCECGCYVGDKDLKHTQINYCSNCGKALDWSKE